MTEYNKLSMRFCRRNLEEEGSSRIRERFSKDFGDLVETDVYHCLGHCTLCHQGPYCTLNDFLFQEKTPHKLEARLERLLSQLRSRLEEALKKEVKPLQNTALLLIDLQNDYCHPDGVFAQKAKFNVADIPSIYPNINRLIRACRTRNMPVIWVKMIWDSDEEVGILAEKSTFLKHEGLRRGTWGAEIVADLEYEPSDYVVEKKRFSAFYKTDLEGLLERLNIRQLIIGGVRSDFCVESTVRDAFFRDYKVILISDGTISYFPHFHEATLKVMNTVFAEVKNTDEILAMMEERG